MTKINIKVGKSTASLRFTLLKYKQIFYVYDRNVEDFARKLAGKHPMYPVNAREENKTLGTVEGICRWLMEQGADRQALVVAVGGGITTDLVGFAASVYKRGIKYANIPTTLLAQVDAAIGGKTGVNLDGYKNMMGVIRQPEFTFICPQALAGLPKREMLSGAAEMLKTFIIKDADNYAEAVNRISAGATPEELLPLTEAAARIKAGIVRKDENEQGLRRVLNLGHTYGHAIEWYQHTNGDRSPYTHGEAVAIGIIAAARKSEELGVASEGLAARLEKDFSGCGLPVRMPYSDSELESALSKDKKVEGGKTNFVLIQRIGKVIVKKI